MAKTSIIHSPLKMSLLALILFTIACWGNTAWITGKALLAQYLIASAWQDKLEFSANNSKRNIATPWPWADTWPVAKLTFPSLNENLYVLAGSHGSSLAFGPGHMDGTALPHELGTMVINGHRDTHFSLLEKLSIGETFSIQSSAGIWRQYKVINTHIIDTRKESWFINRESNEIHLVTCYPFQGLDINPPLRYVVVGVPS